MSQNDSPYFDAAPPELPSGPPSLPQLQRYSTEFTGKTSEFFGIWIINVVLTILTLGIYSAWAKVRTERYFYSNTKIAGSPFEYLADPIKILKGRLIAYVFVIALSVAAKLQMFFLVIPLYLLIIIAMPWIIYLSLRFRARYSSWRGLKFRFVDGVFEAYINFMFKPVLGFFTGNLLWPWVRLSQHEYIGNGHRFGGKRFSFQNDLGKYYRPFLVVIAVSIVAMVLYFVAIFAMIGLEAAGSEGAKPSPDKIMMVLLPVIVVLYAVIFAVTVYIQTRYLNFFWDGLRLGAHRFESSLRARDMIWLYLSNGFAILLSLGLAAPWAMIRMAKYRAAHFKFVSAGSIDEFSAEFEKGRDATGSEMLDALDMDMDIGL
jgi:uncharacterized membrane protein YjgN (DUF898 family)